ncbi:PLD nuclease N-terminal domain-containing protein [Streptomyces sp. 184]|uniref:PLD nuclease N-terminal domain-containing protein n=1 Tax=Streptomyces sp. 184 TaxID=1827526 RepID=UPI00389214A3
MLRYLPFMIFLGLVIYALIDCATTKKEDAKHLPKFVWILLIVLFPLLGSIGWLLAGRNRRRSAAGGSGGRGLGLGGGTGRERRSTWVAPDDNPEFLKKLGDENAKDPGDESGGDGKADGNGKVDGDEGGDGKRDGEGDGDPRK